MGACNLGSLFLHNFVDYPFTKDAKLNYHKLKKTIHTAVRMLDNVIDINVFPLEQFENYQKNIRTIGLGYTGLADMLVMLNMTYGSEEAVRFTDDLTNCITKEAYKASIELAKEKGQFPFLDREKFVQSRFIQKHIEKDGNWESIIKDILEYGIRNGRLISVAPAGTLSLAYGSNCSSGLEPIFSLSYDRKIKIGGQDDENIQIVKMQDYAYGEWLKIKDSKDCIVAEDKFVTAMNLSVDAHLDMLRVIAFNTDMSCSKTINIPSDYSFEDTKAVYDKCYRYGIKGCTIFRPNPIRQGILIAEESKKENIESNDDKSRLMRGAWKSKAPDTIYYEKKVYIGCGKLKVMIGWSDSEQEIQDLYVIRSANGGCERNLQIMVIAMSGMLRLGGSLSNIEKAIEGVGGCNSFTSKRVKGETLSVGSNCGTAILNQIKLFINEKTNTKANIKAEIVDSSVQSDKENEDKYIKQHGEIAFASTYKKCPSCREKLSVSGGCLTCVSCGWTKC